MPPVPPSRDAFGAEMEAHLESGHRLELVERDDRFIQANPGVPGYFAPYHAWSAVERKASRFIRGRILDVGCGAGRVCLHFQEKGHEVIGIDNSPGAIRVSKKRGVRDARCMAFTDIDESLAPIDTVVMFGSNFGLFGGARRMPWLLRRLKRICSPNARIVAATRDPYGDGRRTALPKDHRAYHAWNRKRGRMGGQLRLRVRYRRIVGPWFDYLLASKPEIERLVEGTGWVVERYIDSNNEAYIVVLTRG